MRMMFHCYIQLLRPDCRSCIGMKAFQKGHKTYASLYIGMVLECKSHFTGEMYNILACENRVSDHFI